MTVPTPIAHWNLYDPVGTTTVLDEENSYEADLTTGAGSGGVFGAAGRDGTNTGFQNTSTNNSTIAPDLVATPGLASDFNGELGSLSVWAKVTQTGAGSAGPGFGWSPSGGIAQDAVGVFFENAPSYKPVAYRVSGATNLSIEWDDLTTWPGEWFLWIVTWSTADNRMRFYVNDTLIGSTTFPAATGSTDMFSGSFLQAGSTGTFQDVKLWDVELTQEQISELYAEVTPCPSTIPLDQREFMWSIAEGRMPCTATIQKDGVLGWAAIATDLPCMLEKLPPRRQWDETNQVWVTDEQWQVTISGRTTLPLPGVFNAVRFLVLGMTLESYEFYQSPDDITTTLECRKV